MCYIVPATMGAMSSCLLGLLDSRDITSVLGASFKKKKKKIDYFLKH